MEVFAAYFQGAEAKAPTFPALRATRASRPGILERGDSVAGTTVLMEAPTKGDRDLGREKANNRQMEVVATQHDDSDVESTWCAFR